MPRLLYWGSVVVLMLIVCAALFAYGYWKKNSHSDDGQSITILWSDWEPATYLRELARDFTRETGVQVSIITEPWERFQTVFFDEMDQKSEKFDLVIGDSQWLGRSVFSGCYIELTQWMRTNHIFELMTPTAIAGYANYPVGSEHYWAIPCMGDALGVVYRKDLFENGAEQQAFQQKYGYPLAVPATWEQFRDCAEFFNRPEKGLYGLCLPTDQDYDAVTMLIDMFVWAWGADLGDYGTFRTRGVLDSPAGAQALEFVKGLMAFCPPDMNNAFFTDTVQAFMRGRVAMAISYFAFMPVLLHADVNPYVQSTGFSAVPKGPSVQATSLDGQGLSIVSFSKKKRQAFQFLSWFTQERVQQQWAKLGGFTCYAPVLDSQSFLNAKPYNRAFRESLNCMRDFWNVPEYTEMLAVSQKRWHEYLTQDGISAQDTMSDIASEWEQILEYAGYYKE